MRIANVITQEDGNMAAGYPRAQHEIEPMMAKALADFWRAGWNSALVEAADVVKQCGHISSDLASQRILAKRIDGEYGQKKTEG